MSPFQLLGRRRFLPFFIVQFLGALNDNLFKNALVLLVAFQATSEARSGMLVNLAAGLFIVPFFLFSALAGQMADKFDKARMMRIIKGAEIAIMGLGALGLMMGSALVLYTTLFFMGVHSAFFGPVKYAILPEHLRENELVAGNALVEMGTFIAILVGTIGGGMLAGRHDMRAISGCVLGVATLGFLASRFIPVTLPLAPTLKLNANPFTETVRLTRLVARKESLMNSILGISWYWYFAGTMLAQLPNFTRHMLHSDESVVTFLLAVFAVAIGVGSLLCERLSRGDIELGLVPLGAIGMTIFVADLFFVPYGVGSGANHSLRELLQGDVTVAHLRVVFDLFMTGTLSSFFIVPLYALVQDRSDPEVRSRVIATNNIYNALFMSASAIVTMLLLKLGFTTLDVLLVTAVANAVVSCYIFALIPEFALRFGLWILASSIYRLRYTGRENIPSHGPAVIVANHVSFIDWFVITAACRRPVRFVMDYTFFRMPGFGWFFRLAKAIPIAPAKADAALKEQAFARISAELADGNIVCIFPEGMITRDGAMAGFRPGIERILKSNPVPVIPIGLRGLWGSFFSRKDGAAMHRLPQPSRRLIHVDIGQPESPSATAGQLETRVRALVAEGEQAAA